MKKLILALCLLGATISASANGYYRGGYYGYRGPVYYNNGYNNNWVAPALAGVVVGAALARPYYAPPVYVQQPVYVQPPITYYQQPYPANTTPANPPPFGYHWSYLLDGGCNCYRWVILQDGS